MDPLTFLVGAGTGVVASLAGVIGQHWLSSQEASRNREREFRLKALDETIAYGRALVDYIEARILRSADDDAFKKAEARYVGASYGDDLMFRGMSPLATHDALKALEKLDASIVHKAAAMRDHDGDRDIDGMMWDLYEMNQTFIEAARQIRLDLLR